MRSVSLKCFSPLVSGCKKYVQTRIRMCIVVIAICDLFGFVVVRLFCSSCAKNDYGNFVQDRVW